MSDMSELRRISNTPVICLENITQRFRVIHERPDTLRELFSKFLRHTSSFHDFDAVKDASFSIPKGQMVGLIGRNGSGKSTLLKIIAGVYKPTAGRIHAEGTIAPLIELGAGFHHELTGRENILLNGLLMGFSKREMMQREEAILEFADIGEFIDAPVKQYSTGMYMRLAFSVATSVNPEILLIDEILGVGDTQFQQKCFDRIHAFKRAEKTILLVTHSMEKVIQHCDRVIYLDKGVIVADGDPIDVVDLYRSTFAPEEVVGAG